MAVRKGKQKVQVIHSTQVWLPNILAMVLAFKLYTKPETDVCLL